jgi:phosphatidylserine/phosphatidylglycerophosphate/cardiolipin synthase-like enzyme
MSSLRRALVGLLLTTLPLSLGLPAGSVPALSPPVVTARVGDYTPAAGALFNNPLGTKAQQRRLFRHMIRTIRSVPPRGTIRIAVFSFADKATSRALIAAYRRGVRVKLIFAGHKVYPPMQRVREVIGSDISERSFVVLCDRSCRGAGGQMHAKFFAFSRAGKARHITMVGSNNLTKFNAEHQWSDLYTVKNNEAYFQVFKGWFAQLKLDTPVTSTFIRKEVPGRRVSITPVDLEQTSDPLLDAMASIRCEVPMSELDPQSPTPEVMVATRVLISTHAWNGIRGVSLARRVAELNQAGCAVQVFYGVGLGGTVGAILTNNGVRMTGGVTSGVHTHQKLLIVSGAVDGELATTRVVTGSHNWSTRALGRDDVLVEIFNQTVGLQYVTAFDRMWRKG